MQTSLPPGPGGGPLVSTGWMFRPLPLLERWRAKYGSEQGEAGAQSRAKEGHAA